MQKAKLTRENYFGKKADKTPKVTKNVNNVIKIALANGESPFTTLNGFR